jgi:hypothetical protein
LRGQWRGIEGWGRETSAFIDGEGKEELLIGLGEAPATAVIIRR